MQCVKEKVSLVYLLIAEKDAAQINKVPSHWTIYDQSQRSWTENLAAVGIALAVCLARVEALRSPVVRQRGIVGRGPRHRTTWIHCRLYITPSQWSPLFPSLVLKRKKTDRVWLLDVHLRLSPGKAQYARINYLLSEVKQCAPSAVRQSHLYTALHNPLTPFKQSSVCVCVCVCVCKERMKLKKRDIFKNIFLPERI